MIKQEALTLITPIQKGQHQALEQQLKKIKKELIASKHALFENLGTIHFARWLILEPAEVQGVQIQGRLAFSSNFDHEKETHVAALCTVAGTFIDNIYQYCEGYPGVAARNPESRKHYLEQWQVKNSAFFVGAPGRSIEQIKKESALRNLLRTFLNSNSWENLSARQVHQSLRDKVLLDGDYHWVRQRAPAKSINWLGLIIMGIVLLILLPFILIWLLIIQVFHERHDIPLGLTPSQVSEPHIKKLEEYEDIQNQNQFSQVLIMKSGGARLFTLNGFLLFARLLIRFLFVNGKLMGIPTIHFARWVMIDDNKRMLFLSNFDGSWQQYLGDFIDKSGWGLTSIWSNSVGFPKTIFSLFKGAYDEEHFLAWSRYYEIQTQLWYSAYPHLSIKNIVNNTRIRNGLMRNMNETQSQQFLNSIN